MNKWADYCISAIRYDINKNRIIKTKIHKDNSDSIGNEEEWTRTQVISAIEDGKTFVTITRNNNNSWIKGQDVHVITVNNNKYIRTDKNSKEADNLENLPEF